MDTGLERNDGFCASFTGDTHPAGKAAVGESGHCHFRQVEAECLTGEVLRHRDIFKPLGNRERETIQGANDTVDDRNRHRYDALYQPNDRLNHRLDHRQQAVDYIDHQLDRIYQGRADQTDNHAYQRRHRREQIVYREAQHICQQRLNVVHAEVYDLTDQALYRFDDWDHRAERSSQIVDAEDAFPAQTLLDILQVFQ